jgi:hypothetical protein
MLDFTDQVCFDGRTLKVEGNNDDILGVIKHCVDLVKPWHLNRFSLKITKLSFKLVNAV